MFMNYIFVTQAYRNDQYTHDEFCRKLPIFSNKPLQNTILKFQKFQNTIYILIIFQLFNL